MTIASIRCGYIGYVRFSKSLGYFMFHFVCSWAGLIYCSTHFLSGIYFCTYLYIHGIPRVMLNEWMQPEPPRQLFPFILGCQSFGSGFCLLYFWPFVNPHNYYKCCLWVLSFFGVFNALSRRISNWKSEIKLKKYFNRKCWTIFEKYYGHLAEVLAFNIFVLKYFIEPLIGPHFSLKSFSTTHLMGF